MASSSSSVERKPLQNEIEVAFEEVVPPNITSSSPSTRNKLSYDVFINHRGCDVKETLAKDIYDELTRRGVKVFLDNRELELGDFIPMELQEAMNNALLHIAIFSERYVESAWCLAELSFMLKTKKTIIPIFYGVDPSVLRWVRKGNGIYTRAFCEHERKSRYTPEKLQEWKLALEKVSYLTGCIVNNDNDWNGVLEKLLETILAKVMKHPLLVSKDPLFGLEEKVNDFQTKTIGSSSYDDGAQIVGIVGMGGCGKTTLAKEVYNRKSASIKSSFLYDVRDEASKNQLPKLQKKLLKDLGVQVGDSSFENVHEGMDFIAHSLRSVSMLVVVDDVDNQEQIDALVPPKHILGAGSLIIITTRDLSVLTSAGISSSSIYEMKGLDLSYARGLFCFHAFRSRDSPQEFEDLVKKSLNSCQGLPLSLKVLGGQLCRKPREYWESQLNELSRVLPKGIMSTLKISYDALDPEEQELFLDIACFFFGEGKSLAIEVWDGMGQSGVYRLETLKDKCLVELDQKNRIRMHDHLRDLGREIAKQKSPCRIWFQGQINNSSPQAKKEMQIRGIMAATTSFSDRAWSWSCSPHEGPFGRGFCSSHFEPFDDCVDVKESSRRCCWRHEPSSLHLKFLILKDKFFCRKIGVLLKGLVWLRWFDFDHACLPAYLSLGNLRVLELYKVQRIETLWENNRNPPLQLRELIIQGELIIQEEPSRDHKGSFQGFPKSIGSLKHLKKLVIRCKESFCDSLPDEFCDLKSLEHLELEGFKMLSSLPRNFGNLTKLRHVTLEGLSSLSCLPVSFKQLTCLQYLDLSECLSLNFTSENLDILENITKLGYLSFAYCNKLEALPHHITNQPFLRELEFPRTSIRNVPSDICKLYKLEVMRIGSEVLTSLPDTFGKLSSLTSLYLFQCSNLECLPPSFGNLSSLTSLHFLSCERLECLPPSFGNLSSLTLLHILSCKRLESFPDSLGRLNLLKELRMENSGVKSLPDTFGQLANLRKLGIAYSPTTKMVFRSGSASSLCSLKMLSLLGTLVTTISISEDDCCSLETLAIRRNEELMEIETLPRTLNHLEVMWCPKLEKLPSFASLTSLKHLIISATLITTISIPDDDCCSLETLDIMHNEELIEIETLPRTLNQLIVEYCPKLEKLPSFASLTSLKHSRIDGPNKIENWEQFTFGNPVPLRKRAIILWDRY